MNRVYQLHARLVKTLDPISLRNLLLFSCATTTPVLCYTHAVFLEHAPSIHDAFSWNTMIRAHANSFLPFPALSFFSNMRLRGIPPDHYTFPLLLKACSLSGASEMGCAAHSLVTKLGFGSDVHVGNSLVSFYAGLGLVDLAVHTFDEMPHRDTVSWSAVIDCLTTNGLDHDALAAFLAMQVSGGPVTPDEVTMVSVISAVGNAGASELGTWVYSYVRRRGLYLTVSMGTALIVMFSKGGYINHAAEVFDVMPIKNVRTWTALINGFAAHGMTIEALRTFRRMKEEGFEPDHITFIGVLTACSHGGLLEEGTRLFHSIEGVHGMVPWMEHYGCMVDMMGRAGLVKEAHEFVKKMPIRPNSVVWRTLLGACVSHAYVELAEQVKEEILKLDPDHDGDYVLLSNAYGGIGRWDEKAALRLTMRDRGIEKTPGCSLPY